MSRDGVIRHHLDQFNGGRTCPEQSGAATQRPEASGGCPNSETADADLNQIMAAAACAHCSPILAAFPNLVLPAHPRSRACSGEWSIPMSYRYANLPIEQVRANTKNARTHS